MTREEILEKVCEMAHTIDSYLKVTDLNEQTRLKEDMMFDSLDLVELEMYSEKEFNITLPPDEPGVVTLGDYVDFVLEHIPVEVKSE